MVLLTSKLQPTTLYKDFTITNYMSRCSNLFFYLHSFKKTRSKSLFLLLQYKTTLFPGETQNWDLSDLEWTPLLAFFLLKF